MLSPSIARLVAGALFAGGAMAGQAVLVSSDFVCAHPPYEVQVVSSSPLVVYLAGFLTAEERAHLRAVTHDTFAHSAVAEGGRADGAALHRVRTSQSTNVPRDAVVRCIEERALRFQGLLSGGDDDDDDVNGVNDANDANDDSVRDRLEPLQLVKYGTGQHYHYHTDWFTDPVHATAALGGNRATSFFAYVRVSNGSTDADAATGHLRGGGTSFPLLDAEALGGGSGAWCRYVDCDEPWERGVTFRPVEGNAVFWENMLPGGGETGDPRTLHAGLPVVRGEKIGMNIWTRQGRLPKAVRGEDV